MSSIRDKILKLKEQNRALHDRRQLVRHYIKTGNRKLETGCKDHRDSYKSLLLSGEEEIYLTSLIEENGKEILELKLLNLQTKSSDMYK